MNYDYQYSEREFEPLGNSQKSKNKSVKKIKKYFKKICKKVVGAIISTIPLIILRYFDRRFEKVYA